MPWLTGGLVTVVSDATGATRVPSFLLGLAAGAAWQLVNRRDLASRLLLLSVLAGIGVTVALVSRSPLDWSDMDTSGLYAIGLLLGLVWTEHLLRWQEVRTSSRRPASPSATRPDRRRTGR